LNLRLPSLEWITNYRKEWAGVDLMAGLTSATVVIPKALAYATVAGLPIQVGLYTAFVPLLIYALLGTSRALSVTTSTTLAILVAAQLSEVGVGGDPSTLMALGTLRGIPVAIIVSMIALAQQTANPPVLVLGRKPRTNVFRPCWQPSGALHWARRGVVSDSCSTLRSPSTNIERVRANARPDNSRSHR